MKCKSPLVREGLKVGCGRCIPCLVNKRRIWTIRLLLESLLHDDAAFITLTYDDEHLPDDGLCPKHTQDWLKRVRKLCSPKKLRFYLCGEYGDITARPHYHVLLFGFPSCRYGRPMVFGRNGCPCSNCRLIRGSWSFGISYVGEVTKDSAQYVAQYVTKKFGKSGDIVKGRHPEFNRMSNRPGIGADAIDKLFVSTRNEWHQMKFLLEGDVPTVINWSGQKWPLGRYLVDLLRVLYGLPKGCPQVTKKRMLLEEGKMVDDYINTYGLAAGTKLAEHAKQTARNIEARIKLKGNRLL